MKKIIYIAIILAGMASMLTTSCTQPASVTPLVNHIDSVYKGSSFSISYYDSLGIFWSYTTRDVSWGGKPVVKITSTVNKVDSTHNLVAINVVSPYKLYGVSSVDFYFLADGPQLGTFSLSSPGSYGKAMSEFGLTNPDIVFTDSVGTVTVTYSGSDYIEGTFTADIFFNDPTYTLYPNFTATGSFKVYY